MTTNHILPADSAPTAGLLKLRSKSRTKARGNLYLKRCLSSDGRQERTAKTHNDVVGQRHLAKPHLLGSEL